MHLIQRIFHQLILILVIFSGFISAGVAQDSGRTVIYSNGGADTTGRERKGPTNKTFSISKLITSDFDFTGDKILNVYATIFRDANIRSGYYYYLPLSYSLSWTPLAARSYDFQVTYGSIGADGTGKVTITAILKPKLGKIDYNIVKDILKQDIIGKPEQAYGVTELQFVPMSQAPEIVFTNLTQFGINDKDVSIRAPSDLADPIYISFTTSKVDELLAMFFNNVGLYGDVVVHPSGEDMPSTIRIPFNMKIDAPDTYGKLELAPNQWRINGWQNTTDYPLVISNFHVLRKMPASRSIRIPGSSSSSTAGYKVFTWKTGDIEVPPGAKVQFDAELVPTWIDNDPAVQRIWMDYTIRACASCGRVVRKKIVGTVPEPVKREKIEFTILTPMQFTKAALMKIRVRSFQATTEALSKTELPTLTVKEDGSTLDGGFLYVKSGNVDFEYQIQVYMQDGTKYESIWVRSTNKEVVIGSQQIKNTIPHFANK